MRWVLFGGWMFAAWICVASPWHFSSRNSSGVQLLSYGARAGRATAAKAFKSTSQRQARQGAGAHHYLTTWSWPQKLIPKTQRFEINLCPWQVQVKIQDSTTGQLVAFFFFIFWWQFRPPTMMCRFAIFLGQTADSCWEAQMESIFLIARIKQHKTYLESLSFVLLSAGFLPSLADPCFHTSGMGSEFSGLAFGSP